MVASAQGLGFPPSDWPRLDQWNVLIDSNQSVPTRGAGIGVCSTKTKGWEKEVGGYRW